MNQLFELLFFLIGLVAIFAFINRMCEEEYMDDA